MLKTLVCLVFVWFEVHGQMTSPTSTCSSTAWDASDICRVIEELNELKSTVLELRQEIVNMRGSHENCHLQLQSYSYDCVSQLLGFIRVNNNEVFRCWYDRPAGYITHYRGINTAILHSMDCTASDVKWFDTSSSSNRDSESPLNPGTVQDFINYFTGLPTGTVLLAITCDEAYIELGSALPMLKTAGVDVNGVGGRGMFAFILQKGYPGKTVLVKNPTSDNCAALGLNVSMKGSFVVDSLQFSQTVN